MRGFPCFLKFLVVAFISQGTAFLLASELKRDGGVLVEASRAAKSGSPLRRCWSTPVMDNEYPGGQFSLKPLELPASSSSASSRVPAMSPTSFSTVVIATLTVLKTTDDYVGFMGKVDPNNRAALSKMLNIDGVIETSQKEIKRLQDSIDKACHDVLDENGFNWGSVKGQGYLAIAEGVAQFLKSSKNLAENFNVPLNTEVFGRLLGDTLLKCQITLKEISKEKTSLKNLRELACKQKRVEPQTYSWNACDF